MAQLAYTYVDQGVTLAQVSQQVPGTGAVAPAVPIRLQTVTWDSTYKDDLDAMMAGLGWSYLYQGTAPTAKVIAQIEATALGADAASIAAAAGWVTVLTQTIVTRGGSDVDVRATAVGDTVGGTAQARVLLNGGDFTDSIVGAVQYDLRDSSYGASATRYLSAIPDTSPTETTYTFELQFAVTGGASTVVPRKGTELTLVELR